MLICVEFSELGTRVLLYYLFVFFFLSHYDLILNKSFLKNLDFYVSGCSIFHVIDPNNYMYLAATPHLTLLSQGPPSEAKI